MPWFTSASSMLLAGVVGATVIPAAVAQSPLPAPDVFLRVDASYPATSTWARATPLADGGMLLQGRFTHVNDAPRGGIARLNSDGSLATTVYAVSGVGSRAAEAPDGTLFVTRATADDVVKLDATGAVDPSFNLSAGSIYAMTIAADGDLILAGGFTSVNGTARARLAKVSPTTGELRSTFAPAVPMPIVRSMVRSGDDVFLGGQQGGGRALIKVSTSTGVVDAQWQPAAQGLTGVTELALSPDAASLYVSGTFSGFDNLSRVNLAKIATGGAGATDPSWRSDASRDCSVAVAPNGWLYVADPSAGLLTRRQSTNGATDTTWNATIEDQPIHLAFDANGGLVASGSLTSIAGQPRRPFTWWTPATTLRHPSDVTIAAAISDIAYWADGSRIVAGRFREADGLPRSALLRLHADGTLDTSWAPSVQGVVSALAIGHDGNVIVGGSFNSVNGVARNGLARLDGSGTLLGDTFAGTHPNFFVTALALDIDGALYAASLGGERSLYRFLAPAPSMPYALDSAFWPNFPGPVSALIATGGGLLYFGIDRGPSQRSIRRAWTIDGNADPFWSVTVDGPVYALALDRDRSLLVGGDFRTVGGQAMSYLARLPFASGTLPAPDGPVMALRSIADDIYVAGAFDTVGGQPRRNLARVKHAGLLDPSWHPDSTGTVHVLATGGNGALSVGGQFHGHGAIGGAFRSGIADFALSTPDVIFDTGFE